MDQDRLDELDKRVDNLEQGNGWHEWGKHVLKELERLNKGQDTMNRDNNAAHGKIYKKLDDQRDADEARLVSCNDRFLPAKFFHWLILVLIVVLGGLATLGIANKVSISKHAAAEAAIVQPAEIEKPKIAK